MSTKEIYSLRDSFSIIGLTGRTGSGCTLFADIISKEIRFDETEIIRRPVDVEYIDTKILSDSNTIFKRKYSICYNFFKKNNKPYKKISYLSVLIFYSIHYGIKSNIVNTKPELLDYLQELIDKNFIKSIHTNDSDYIEVKIIKNEIETLSTNYEGLIDLFKKLNPNIKSIKETIDFESLNECFFGPLFEEFANNIFHLFARKDYYLGAFFVHRLGNKIRATGNPLMEDKNLKEIFSADYIYSVVHVINKLIKAWKVKMENSNCHICIDSLRNSLEIMFLKERYSAFYMISIHNEERYKERIRDRIENAFYEDLTTPNPNGIEKITSKLISLDKTEHDVNDFKLGHFFAPDVENCIQKSDIHINNPGNKIANFKEEIRRSIFYTMTEQWIKIKSLILHPGLITPSHEERCMQIAFNSKFNSGCISRQVGAIITDENNSIRSVGWNDVPKGSIPCNIRSLEDIISPSKIDSFDKSYSPFETGTSGNSYQDGGNFSVNTKETLRLDVDGIKEQGLNYSFCFKSLHNKYEEKDNQVHTRSLHAEENAMLQISKFGGQPLKNGTLYTTASPCELCAKKAYQLGLNIVFIDPYPGISMKHILTNGYNQPTTKMFTGIIGRAYNKLFEPLLSYKDELALLSKTTVDPNIEISKKIKCLMEEIFDNKLDGEINIEEFKETVKYLIEKGIVKDACM